MTTTSWFRTRPVQWIALRTAALGLACAAASVGAQPYPHKPIKLIVPFAAGSSTDALGRAIGQKLGDELGQPVVVENKPGAVGRIGAESVAKAAPDGYTLLLGTQATNAAPHAFMARPPYDAARDFTPISFVGVLPQVLIVNNDVPARTLPEFIAYARANPEKLSYAWTSSVTRIAAEALAQRTNVKFMNVPYKTGTTALTDVLSGQVSFTIVDTIVSVPQVRSGKVRALAVTSPARTAALPEIPTVAEAAQLPDYQYMGIFAMFGPAGLPTPVVTRLQAAMQKVGADPELHQRFGGIGLEIQTSTSEQLRERFKQEASFWFKAAAAAGIVPE